MRKLIRKTRQERGQLALYLGYALRLRTSPRRRRGDADRAGADLPGRGDAGDRRRNCCGRPSGIPLFNLEVLKSLPTVDSGNVIDEAIHLSDELGLANAEDDLPPWDEIILRLQRCRPDWDWKEDLNPYALSGGPPLAELTAPGIYNRAVLFAATRSPFTYGLEIELRKLAQLDEEAVASYRAGAVAARREHRMRRRPRTVRFWSCCRSTAEQRQAVVQGLSAPLTVVTGPPGTGKSQVVISLLANMAWQGRQRAVREQEQSCGGRGGVARQRTRHRIRCCCGWARRSITRASRST